MDMQIKRLDFREITGDMPVVISKKPREFSRENRLKGELTPPPPPPSFTEEQLRAAERDSYKKGFLEGTEEGRKQAQSEQAEIEKKLRETVEHFAQAIRPIFEDYRNMALSCRQEAPKIALAIARKVAGAALAENALAEVEKTALRCIEAMAGEPGLTITVHESLARTLEQKLAEIEAASQQPSDITVMGDATLGIADCRVEWKKGALARQTDQLWQEVERAVASIGASAAHDTNVALAALETKLPEAASPPPPTEQPKPKE